ncbi:MAG: ABC transporter permease, partial [Clostridiales bacterium]|nr:ABC transporter permease [Clostridiales bacterium]
IPQSYRRLIPPVGNEFIALLKDSSLVMIIGMVELMNRTSQIAVNSSLPIIYIPAAILYLTMTSIFTYVFEKLEKKYSIYE